MDDGEVELSDNVLLGDPNSSPGFRGSISVDTFLEDFLKNTRTCTHTHACNRPGPGPDSTHTHTCYHTHTQVISSEEDHQSNHEHPSPKPKRSSGNREAVRKYREKKKAHTAYLEEEVKKLRQLNQQLIRKLQGQAVLEAEVSRLRSLLLDIRGKIDSELGAFPFQKLCNSKEGGCGMQSVAGEVGLRCKTDDLLCFHPQPGTSTGTCNITGAAQVNVPWEENCEAAIVGCHGNRSNMTSAGG